jgi:hypothetical protein
MYTINTTALVTDPNVNTAPSFAPPLAGTGKAIIAVGKCGDIGTAITRQADGQGNYSRASINLKRSTGVNAQDVFGAIGSLRFIDGKTDLSGTTNCSFNQSGDTLTRLNEELSSLTYANNSDTPPASVQFNWTFNGGNEGAQGIGGALTSTRKTTVHICAVNDAPSRKVIISGTALRG